MKKIIMLILTAAMLLSLSACASLPLAKLAEKDENIISGTCGENLSWTFNEMSGMLSIVGSGTMTDWITAFDVPWYSFSPVITSIVLPDGITNIGNMLFKIVVI